MLFLSHDHLSAGPSRLIHGDSVSQRTMATNSNSVFLAKPPGDCCLKGSIHVGEPQGIYQTIAGVKTYIARPSEKGANGNIVLYFPDVWGLFTNGLLIMDGFAAAGYLVLGLDYFRGVMSCHEKCSEPLLNLIFFIRIQLRTTGKIGLTNPTRILISKLGSKCIRLSPTRQSRVG